MNSSLYLAQAVADIRQPHPLRGNPFFGHYAPHEAAQELVRALKGGRKANPSGAGSAIRAAYKVRICLDALMTHFHEAITVVDPGSSTSGKPLSALPDMVADASRDAREIAKLVRFSTGAITFAENRAEASRLVQMLHGKLERILSVNLRRPTASATMSVDEMIAAAAAGNVVLFAKRGRALKS